MENVLQLTGLELLFEEQVRLTDFVEYGFSMQDLLEGRPIPPEGIRFDIYFEGELKGSRLNGNISGVDYLTVRSDGRFFLNLYARIKTDDGASIQVVESGINEQGELRLTMEFHTNDEKYSWLNKEKVLGLGFANLQTGEAEVKGYLI